MHDLHNHQQVVKSAIYRAINAGNRTIMVKAATAFGKTVLAASIIHDALSKDTQVVFCVPTLPLIDQTLKEFSEFGLECGVIQAEHYATDYGKQVQIASIQTIASQLKRNNKAQMFQMAQYYKNKLVIVDEAHIMFDAQKALNGMTRKPVIGLSATPWAAGLGEWYSELISGVSVGWLIENGYLSKYRAFSHYVPDMKGVATSATGDYSLKESGEKYDKKIIGDIVGTWVKHAEGRQTILFAPRVVDAERFAAEFRSAGYAAAAVSGYMDNADCRAEVERFRNHETTIICSVAKLTTGFDVRDVGCILDVQPCKSLMKHCQKLGRGLRTHPDKDDVIILDNAGNLLRNGLPDDEFPEEMSMDKDDKRDRKPPEEPLPKACTKCNAMKPPKVHACPACGFAPEKKSDLEVAAGDLVELKKASAKRNRDSTWPEKQRFLSELQTWADHKQYKKGWAYHAYKERFGVLPFDSRLKGLPNSDQVSTETMNHIKYLQIKNAKRRA